MQLSHLFAALPALVAALPNPVEEAHPMITERAVDPTQIAGAAVSWYNDLEYVLTKYTACLTATDERGAEVCVETAQGWNTKAASYLVDQLSKTDIFLAQYDLFTDDGFVSQVQSITDGPAVASFEVAHASIIATSLNRDGFVSVQQQALSLQTASSKAAAAPVAVQTGLNLAAGVAAGVAGLAFAM